MEEVAMKDLLKGDIAIAPGIIATAMTKYTRDRPVSP